VIRADIHPTKRALLESARELTEIHGVDNLTVDMVLTHSKVSKGSLYHHFEDFDSLIHEVQLRKFSEFVEEGINFLEQAFGMATNAEQFRANLHAMAALAQDSARRPGRIERARIFGTSGTSLSFTQALSNEQERLRQRGEELIAEAQSRGWVNSSLSARALSSFILGFTFGRVLDDVCETHVNSDEWNEVVRQFLDRVLLNVV
jgi:AcrR family transcriptional regulator